MHALALRQDRVDAITERTEDELMTLVPLGIGEPAGAVPELVARVPQPAAAGRVG